MGQANAPSWMRADFFRPLTGSVPLHAYPGDLIQLACEKCGRRGQYPKHTLVVAFVVAFGGKADMTFCSAHVCL